VEERRDRGAERVGCGGGVDGKETRVECQGVDFVAQFRRKVGKEVKCLGCHFGGRGRGERWDR
jgi:hypothetical protein